MSYSRRAKRPSLTRVGTLPRGGSDVQNAQELLVLAEVILAGIVGGQLAQKIRIPHITGQILMGILLGQTGLILFGPDSIRGLDVVTQFALGLITLNIGEHLNLRMLRNAGKRLFFLVLTESTITPALVFGATYAITRSPWLPLLLGAMAISTSPATIIALVKETRSHGVFVKTLGAAVALNNIVSIALFAIARSAARFGLARAHDRSFLQILGGPGLAVGAAIALGVVVGLVVVLVTRRVVRTDHLAAYTLIALLVVAGAAIYLNISLLLACLLLGFTLANLSPGKPELGGGAFSGFETAIFAAFFTLAGMQIQLQNLSEVGFLAAAVLISRFAGKMIATDLAMRFARATAAVRRYLGLALIPQAGPTIGLVLLIQQDPQLRPLHGIILAVGLTVVIVNELVGSVTTSVALKGSGEMGKDRPRLIDFLQEQNILTDFHARTKEEAIEKLCSLLIQTNHLPPGRDGLLATVLKREAEASTCIGNGLAIPHGILPEGQAMYGVMGLSAAGLAFETPDGRPVHCIVLLATPESQRERHLEVIAALARAIGKDPAIQERLFTAQTPAHAYEILHAEEASDFNYYLGA